MGAEGEMSLSRGGVRGVAHAGGTHHPLCRPKDEIEEEILSVTRSCAKYYRQIGLSVIPIAYGDKKPKISWKTYQQRLPTNDEIEEWFSEPANIGIVTGTVSGNLVVIDFDSEDVAQKFAEALDEELQQKLGRTWIVRTGKGLHIYVKLPRADLVPRTRVRFVDGVDIKAEGGYVVAPPSLHPAGVRYEFATSGGVVAGPPNVKEPVTLTESEWEKILSLLEVNGKKVRTKRCTFKNLEDSKLIKLKELLSEAWSPGNRQMLALFFAGWAARAGVHPADLARLYKMIAVEKGDKELNERLSTIYYTYLKHYGDAATSALAEVDKLIEEWKKEGVLKGNVSKGRGYESKIKGKRGVQEILETALGEERALEVLHEIEETLGKASPYMDSITAIMDYERQIYAVANLKKFVVVTAKRITNGDGKPRLIYRAKVFIGAPTNVKVYYDPLGGPTKFELTWETATRPKLTIGPATFREVIEKLESEGLVVRKRLASDVLSAILDAYLSKGKAEIRNEIDAPGFYFIDGELKAVKVELEDVDEELAEALQLLNELAEWFGHALDKFATVVKWGLVAPFSYAMKQKRKWMPWLYLYGVSGAGKTTLGEIVLKIWGLGSDHVKAGTSIDTVPKLGHVLSQSTFPVLINEPGNAIKNEYIVEAMKNAVESLTARGKHINGKYTEIPSLAPLIMASNKGLPKDDALLRRLIVVTFTYGEKIDIEKAKEFEKNVKPKLEKLRGLGKWVANRLLENPRLLDLDWEGLADRLLAEAYEEAGLKVPAWAKQWYAYREDVYEQMRELIRELLIKKINEAFFRSVGRVIEVQGDETEVQEPSEVDLRTRVVTVLKRRFLEWGGLKDDKAFFTVGFAKEVEERIGDVGTLKGLAELLGWEYKNIKVNGKTIRAALVPLDKLIEFLS